MSWAGTVVAATATGRRDLRQRAPTSRARRDRLGGWRAGGRCRGSRDSFTSRAATAHHARRARVPDVRPIPSLGPDRVATSWARSCAVCTPPPRRVPSVSVSEATCSPRRLLPAHVLVPRRRAQRVGRHGAGRLGTPKTTSPPGSGLCLHFERVSRGRFSMRTGGPPRTDQASRNYEGVTQGEFFTSHHVGRSAAQPPGGAPTSVALGGSSFTSHPVGGRGRRPPGGGSELLLPRSAGRMFSTARRSTRRRRTDRGGIFSPRLQRAWLIIRVCGARASSPATTP